MDTRRKDIDWTVTSSDGSCTVSQASLAVLMDIRDELRGIRRRLDCQMFLGIPNTLADIRRNTAKPRKKRK